VRKNNATEGRTSCASRLADFVDWIGTRTICSAVVTYVRVGETAVFPFFVVPRFLFIRAQDRRILIFQCVMRQRRAPVFTVWLSREYCDFY
jgi:hypothetical protein